MPFAHPELIPAYKSNIGVNRPLLCLLSTEATKSHFVPATVYRTKQSLGKCEPLLHLLLWYCCIQWEEVYSLPFHLKVDCWKTPLIQIQFTQSKSAVVMAQFHVTSCPNRFAPSLCLECSHMDGGVKANWLKFKSHTSNRALLQMEVISC